MSTYLLALAGGDFRSRCAPSLGSSLKLCLWAEPEDISQLDFALTTTAEMFEAIQSYFPITYPLRKLDILGLHTYPTGDKTEIRKAIYKLNNCCCIGAMENWGLIVHNFNTLSVGSLQHDSLRFRQFVISKIICHEILHQVRLIRGC